MPNSLSGQHVQVDVAAADVGGPRGRDAAVDALGPPQAELDHLVALGGQADARGLGGDERLEVDEVQERRLEQLALEQRPLHADQRLVGEDDRAFGDGDRRRT